MLTITIFAAGLVCLAGVLRLGLWRAQAQVSTVPAQASADEQGITLQTLIVTAVLVLMAVAAGVVIVAITNNAAEDLEEQATSIESQCNKVEIYDPVLAARNVKGQNAGEESARIGCIPVCFFTAGSDGVSATDYTIKPSEVGFSRSQPSLNKGTGDSTVSTAVAIKKGRQLLFETSSKFFDSDDDLTDDGGTTHEFVYDDTIAEVRVGPDQRSCHAYSANGDRL